MDLDNQATGPTFTQTPAPSPVKSSGGGWKIIAIIFIIISIILAAATGYLAWQQFSPEPEIVAETDSDKVADQTPDADQYLVINKWGVKFVVPEGLTKEEIVVHYSDQSGITGFSTTMLDNLWRQFCPNTPEPGAMRTLARSSSAIIERYGGQVDISDRAFIQLDGYYYWDEGKQDLGCWIDLSQDIDWHNTAANAQDTLLGKLIESISII